MLLITDFELEKEKLKLSIQLCSASTEALTFDRDRALFSAAEEVYEYNIMSLIRHLLLHQLLTYAVLSLETSGLLYAFTASAFKPNTFNQFFQYKFGSSCCGSVVNTTH